MYYAESEYGPHGYCHGCGEIVYCNCDGCPVDDGFEEDGVLWCSTRCYDKSLEVSDD